MTTLPVTSCPSCWQRKDDPAKHYCTPCQAMFNDDYPPEHEDGACENLKCRLCYDQDDDDRGVPDTDDDYDEPYGDRDFERDVNL